MNKFTVAVLQLDSQDDVQKNLDTVVSFIERLRLVAPSCHHAGEHELCGFG